MATHTLSAEQVQQLINKIQDLCTALQSAVDNPPLTHHEAMRGLFVATKEGKLDVVKKLVSGHGLSKGHILSTNCWLLKVAAKNGHLDILRHLVSHYGITAKDVSLYFNHMIAMTIKGGHLDILEYLLDTFQYTNPNNTTPLLLALKAGHVDIMKFFAQRLLECTEQTTNIINIDPCNVEAEANNDYRDIMSECASGRSTDEIIAAIESMSQ